MKKLWGYIVGAFSLIAGLFFYERAKRRAAESLNDNLDTKEKVLDKQKKVMENEISLEKEEQLREEELTKLEEKKNEDLSVSNLVDFFNKRK